MTADPLHVVFCLDRDHFPGLLAALRSARAHTARPEALRFHVQVGPGEGDELRRLLAAAFPGDPLQMSIGAFRPDPWILEFVAAGREHTYAAPASQYLNFCRFHLPRLYPELDRIMYLDGDLVVQADLAELARLATLERHSLAAVPVATFGTSGGFYDKESPLLEGIDLDAPVFNNGVFVTSLERWRRDDVTARLEDRMRAHREHLGDMAFGTQTLMNLVFYRAFEELPAGWNLRPLGNDPSFTDEQLEAARILHWAGKTKPWQEGAFYQRYWRPWGDPLAAGGPA